MQSDNIKRLVAKKVSIGSLVSGRYVTQEGWNPNYVLIQGNQKIERANIIGIVTIPPSGSENTQFTVEDGTGKLIIQSFEKIPDLIPGDCVLIIGRPRVFREKILLVSEIIKKINPKWIPLRKLELGSELEVPEKQEVPKEKGETKPIGEIIFRIIKNLDSGEGADVEEVITNLKKQSIENGEEHINKLLQEGELFESRRGKIKIL